jgi:hypothetical protein
MKPLIEIWPALMEPMGRPKEIAAYLPKPAPSPRPSPPMGEREKHITRSWPVSSSSLVAPPPA